MAILVFRMAQKHLVALFCNFLFILISFTAIILSWSIGKYYFLHIFTLCILWNIDLKSINSFEVFIFTFQTIPNATTMNFKVVFQLVFLVFAQADVLFSIYNPLYRVFTKPMIMIVLMLYFQYQTWGVQSIFKSVFLLALFFAWLGDGLLLRAGELNFMTGLGAFLQTQLLYGYLFFKKRNLQHPRKFWVIGVVIIGLAAAIPVFANAGKLLVPVMIYFLAILTMVSMAVLRDDISSKSYFSILLGACFFLVSDGLLAFNKFVMPNVVIEAFVMPTYIIAQYFIVEGMILEINETAAKRFWNKTSIKFWKEVIQLLIRNFDSSFLYI